MLNLESYYLNGAKHIDLDIFVLPHFGSGKNFIVLENKQNFPLSIRNGNDLSFFTWYVRVKVESKNFG